MSRNQDILQLSIRRLIMNNNQNEQCEESCIVCDLVSEFKLMCDEDVHWENALRHVLHVALEIKDEVVADLVDEQYTLGYEEGLATGVNNAVLAMSEYAEATEDKIAEYRAERKLEVETAIEVEAEEIEDISDEEFDKIAKLIREDKESR